MTTGEGKRIRIGNWLVPYDDATSEVVVERTPGDILAATPGDANECMNTQCIRAQRNEHVFPHPVLMVSTIARRVYIVDRLTDAGLPAHAIRYELSQYDRSRINEHDRYGAGQPGELRLRIPRDPKGSPKRAARKERGKHASPGKHAKGVVSKPDRKAGTSKSLGAKHRYHVAVGALKLEQSTSNNPTK